MKYLVLMVTGLCLFCGAGAFAAEKRDYDFEQERMILTSNSLMVISTLDTQDHVTAYDFSGRLLWNVPFHAKIVSWRMTTGSYLFVFSKARSGYGTYVTCIDALTGALVWQRP